MVVVVDGVCVHTEHLTVPLQGVWEAPFIANPDFVEDKELYKRGKIAYVAFELWQVKSGTIFDNIYVGDSKADALKFAKATWGKSIEKEKEMKAQVEVRRRCVLSAD
jgi:calreticulin